MLHKPATWWVVMLIATIVFAICAALLLEELTHQHKLTFLLLLVSITLVGDVFVALGMQKIAPTWVGVGPGERQTSSDLLAEAGVAIADFDERGRGRVRVRGEVWQARAVDDGRPNENDPVRILGRDGLTLQVSAERSLQAS